MKRLKTSIVAWSGAGALASFAILYQFLPYDKFLDLSLAMAFGACFATVGRYFIDAMRSIRSGKAGPDFFIVAIFSIVLWLTVQRAWGIALRAYGRPEWLTTSPMTIFIPWMLTWSILLALFAPDIEEVKDGPRDMIWRSIAVFVAGAMAGFVLASSFGVSAVSVDVSGLRSYPHLANRAQCPDGEDVWTSSSGVYHTVDSPYRETIHPRECFSTEEDAKAKGFRPPRGLK